MSNFEISPRARSESELVIRRLYRITSHYDSGFDQQVKELLTMGCERFGLDIGILSRITGDKYEVVQAVAPAAVELAPGDTFPLGDTYCCITLEANGPVGFEHVGESAASTHPAYSAFGLEAYVGTPIRLGDELYGTLNFSSATPRQRKFLDVDIECLMFMRGWLEGEIQRRIAERELAETLQRFEQLSRIDPLTQMLNRRGLTQYLERTAARGAFDGTPIGVVLIDLDDFKSINDNYGHSIGDRVIKSTAESVANAIRPTDVVGRIGGDEFMALLPSCQSGACCHKVAERIRAAVANQTVVTSNGAVARVTCSIGAALMRPDQLSVTDVLIEVEGLLRQSKKKGKDQLHLACAEGTAALT